MRNVRKIPHPHPKTPLESRDTSPPPPPESSGISGTQVWELLTHTHTHPDKNTDCFDLNTGKPFMYNKAALDTRPRGCPEILCCKFLCFCSALTLPGRCPQSCLARRSLAKLESPQMWVWPQLPLEVPTPRAVLEDPSLSSALQPRPPSH